MYLLDSTVIIDFANGYPPGERVVDELFGSGADLLTCGVVSCEVLSKGSDRELRAIRALLDALEFVAVDPDAARWAGDRRRERIASGGGRIGVSDALIAGLAWRLGAVVVTRSARDFEPFGIPVLAYGTGEP